MTADTQQQRLQEAGDRWQEYQELLFQAGLLASILGLEKDWRALLMLKARAKKEKGQGDD